MEKIGILTDTASDLSLELYEKNNIERMPFYVTINGKEYLSGKDITVEELFQYAKKNKSIPRTSQITPSKFIEYFEGYLKKYDQLIYIGISSQFSGTINNANIAASEFDGKVKVVDSLNLSSGIGLLVLRACKWRDMGKTSDEIVQELNRCIPLVRTQFAINTLTYLHYGGRCSDVTRLFGTLLKIKPIVKVVNGKMVVAKKPIGKLTKALNVILQMVEADKDNIDLDNVMITHCLADEEAQYLKEGLTKFLQPENVHETFADVIVSSHCGPKTIGILYILKK